MNTKQEDFARDWQDRVRRAVEYRDRQFSRQGKDKYDNICKDNRKYYRGDWNKSIIPVNRVFSYGRSMIPSTYFRSPRITATATRPGYAMHARVVEVVDNWLIDETKLKKTLKKSVLNSYTCGVAPVKLGYDSQYGFLPEQGVDENMATMTQESRKEDRRIEYHDIIKPGMPWALPERAEHVIGPPGYDDWEAMPWIAHRILRPLEDVKQDQKYKHTKDLQGTKTLDYVDHRQMSLFNEYERIPICELIEVRDKATRSIYTFCEGQTLLSAMDVLQIEGLPWEFLVLNDDPDYPWGIPDVSLIEPQQQELNEIRTQAKRHRAITLLKFLYKRGVLKKEALDALFSGEVGPGVPVDDEQIASVIQILQPHIPPDLRAEAVQVEADLRNTIRMGENQTGTFRQGTPPSAAETATVAGTGDLNTSERRDMVADLLTGIVRKWNQYIFTMWDAPRVAEIAGPDGQMWWVQYTGDELRGEYYLRIDPDSGFPVSRAVRMETAAGLLKMYGGDQLIDQIGLRKMHLSQLEWLHPGITSLVREAPTDIASALSNMRQPNPEKGQGHMALGQRGGGRGKSPEKPIEFQEFKNKYEKAGGGHA